MVVLSLKHNHKIYKYVNIYNIRMFPSDPKGSLDDNFSKAIIKYNFNEGS